MLQLHFSLLWSQRRQVSKIIKVHADSRLLPLVLKFGMEWIIGVLVVGILDNNKEKIIVWDNHELVLLSPDSHEIYVIRRVNVLEHGLSLINQVVDEPAVLGGGGVVEG